MIRSHSSVPLLFTHHKFDSFANFYCREIDNLVPSCNIIPATDPTSSSVNNMEKEENCLRALLYVWEEQSQKRFYSWTTIIKCVKNLGAVQLANALAQRTDNHSALH